MSLEATEFGTDDPRMGKIIKEGMGGDVVFVGFPHDEGVRRNGGRVGAKEGPNVVRGFVQKIGTVVNPEYKIDLRTISVSDSGNIKCETSLEDAHSALTERVSTILKQGRIAFIVGGGNDQSYPNAKAMLQSLKGTVGVINIDAHLDVRPKKEGKVHSGSPFRLLLEDDEMKTRGTFCEFGAQGSQCSTIHWNYVLSHKNASIAGFNSLRKSSTSVLDAFKNEECMKKDNVFVSFDIDSINGADCPGVSCPANVGFSSQEALDICFAAGSNPKVRLMDVSEFNPTVESYRTGRLVAQMFYHFLLGVASR
eukprot:CAMPEP_0168536818 /NCGR_PEP_ID=MMETSP0405-20121227/19850_1 /TAXON_ID=498012 /ORGANISM="Trichosphaerium sp, Strain Am-I-7 wt" /LENGTH=308 /DNA_ID=CAMNT_0008565045 /DNA_START=206 /DNA_END=1132 /DNA_ORIENTATION=+